MIDRYDISDFFEAHHVPVIITLLAVVFGLAVYITFGGSWST